VSSNSRRLPLLHDDPQIDSVTVALNYRCQSRCRFCFIERELDMKLEDTSTAYLDHVCDENVQRGGLYKRIIFSGAECTLRPDLPEVAHRARKRGGFERVQIQTNGRRLSDRSYLIKLLAAGIDEFFVSVHASNAEQDLFLTRSPGSFDEMVLGLRNLKEVGATFMSNSVVTKSSYLHLPALADFLVDEQVPECHFWAFIEYGDIDQKSEHVRFTDAAPYLQEAVAKLRTADRRIGLSWFPECLLGEHAEVVNNHRATLLIHDEFSERAAAHSGFSCPHQSVCPRFGKTCVGLHERYVEVFGNDADALAPIL
jgi:MoaA/NifB/PqqE/SkfB family radical SAM enzyme